MAKTTQSIVTVGTFDGIHLGHRAILQRVGALGRAMGMPTAVVTFANHPLSVIAPERAPLWAAERAQSLQTLAQTVDSLDVIDFDADTAAMTAREFFALLRRRHNAHTVVMGYDNTFGSDRLKSHADYSREAALEGMAVDFVDAVAVEPYGTASSSLLRQAIAQGRMDMAAALTGHAPAYHCRVVEGRHLGRTIGFPTMTLTRPRQVAVPPAGVYAATCIPHDADAPLPAVMSIGSNPTIGNGDISYELHLIDGNPGPMYGKEVRLTINHRLRDIKKFPDIDTLRQAIGADVDHARQYFINHQQALHPSHD